MVPEELGEKSKQQQRTMAYSFSKNARKSSGTSTSLSKHKMTAMSLSKNRKDVSDADKSLTVGGDDHTEDYIKSNYTSNTSHDHVKTKSVPPNSHHNRYNREVLQPLSNNSMVAKNDDYGTHEPSNES